MYYCTEMCLNLLYFLSGFNGRRGGSGGGGGGGDGDGSGVKCIALSL